MDKIIDFFQKNKEQVVDFIDIINVNHERPTVKFGYKENEGVSIAFYIHNETDSTITNYDERIRCLFNLETSDIKELESILDIKKPCKINCSPYLKISDTPLIHAFHISINYTI